jgi:lambda family phage tail tape measure protein
MAERQTSVRLSVVGGGQVKAELASVGAEGQRSLERITRATEPAGRGLRAVDAVTSEARRSVERFAAQAGPAGTLLRAFGPAGLAAAAGIGAAVAALSAGVREFEQKERAFLRLEQVIRATGNAAGITAKEIRDIARQLESSTLASDVDAMGAGAILATFRAISGDEFRRALRAAQDLAAVFGQDIRSAATQLGKALEDPIQGLTALRRVGVSFTAAQRETIAEMVRMGDVAGAQRAILETLERQVGGAGEAEARGVSGAFHRATSATSDFLAKLAEVTGAAGATQSALDGIAGAVDRLSRGLGVLNDEGDVGQVVVRLNRRLIEARDYLRRLEETSGDPLSIEIVKSTIADLEARIDAVIERGRAEVAAMEAAEAGRRQAEIEARTEQGFERLRELRKELEGLATPEEKIAAINARIAETIAQLERLRTENNTGAIDEAIAAAQEIARRQIDAVAARDADRIRSEGKAIFESVRTAAEEYADTLANLNRLLEAGAISQEIYARAIARAREQLEAAERIERRRLLRSSGDLFGAARAFLDEYVERAGAAAGLIEQSFTRAFSAAEDAVAEFVRKGRIDFASLVSSMLADLARLSVRQAVLAPLASWLGGLLGGGGNLLAGVFHDGGMAGAGGPARSVPAIAFAGAPRFHDGSGMLGLRPDEVPAILQRGERVLSRRETRDWDRGRPVQVNIATPDIENFRRARTQIAADIARAVAFGSRGL